MIGERLGNWVIYKELGRGGMGRVFLAREEISGRQAALKVLAGELAQQSGFLQRFEREIESLSLLDHPNIVRFYDSGCDNDMYYYAMEYVDGPNLETILLKQGRLSWQEVLDIAHQVCRALRHVHDHGIIHRDIKPPNILYSSSGVIKLSDFGIAKLFASSHLTATGGVIGTAEYLSPEQAAGKPASKRSDLYSLGVVMYTLLVGRPPFRGTSIVDLLHKHQYGQFDRPQQVLPELPYEVDELVCQLLDKDPEKRPADCQVLGRQIERLQKKLERKGNVTQFGELDVTEAENRPDVDIERGPGPATLMSRLVRAELNLIHQEHILSRIFNRVWILVPALMLCIGTIVWAFWPMSEKSLYENGAALMASERPADWEQAWKEYLGPLTTRYPDHPYQEEVKKFREQLESSRLARQTPHDAQRFYQQGERLRQEGQLREAERVWKNLIVVFENSPSEADWVKRAQQGLEDMRKAAVIEERWQRLKPALDRAQVLREEGKREEAEKIWKAVEELYRNDPWAEKILQEIARARKQ